MHLVLTIAALEAGGAERVLSELANHWSYQGHQISLITFAKEKDLPFYFLNPAINLIQLELPPLTHPAFVKRLILLTRRFWHLRKTLKSLKPDLMVSFIDLMNIGSLLAAKGLKIPVIISERTDPNSHYTPFLYRFLRQKVYPWAEKLVVQTSTAARYFSFLDPQKITVIPNALKSPALFKKPSESVSKIVSVGRLGVEKDHKTLIQAFAGLIQRYPNLQLTIYGEGQERSALEQLIQTLNLQHVVAFPGIIPNVSQALAEADLFIFPSLYEGFPNALGEAMAMGLPVIASDCPGNKALVKNNVNGCLFSVGDVKALTKITADLIQHQEKRKFLGEKAQEVCLDFSSQRIFGLWDKLINEVYPQDLKKTVFID